MKIQTLDSSRKVTALMHTPTVTRHNRQHKGVVFFVPEPWNMMSFYLLRIIKNLLFMSYTIYPRNIRLNLNSISTPATTLCLTPPPTPNSHLMII